MDDPQYRSADGSAIRIWLDTAKNTFLSEQERRPIFDEVIMLEVIAPGSKDSTPVFEVERRFFEDRFPIAQAPQYAVYKDQIEAFKTREANDDVSGTPLTEWPEITRSMAASLRESRVFSVEGLAALPDSKLNLVGPDGRTWREKAKAWLASTKDSGVATALAAQLETAKGDIARRDADLRALSEQMNQMAAQLAALQAAQPPPAPQDGQQAPPPLPPATPVAGRGRQAPAPPLAPVAEGSDLVPAKPPGLEDIV